MFEGGEAKSPRLAPLYAEHAARGGIGVLDASTVAALDPKEGIHLTAKAHERLGLAVAEAAAALND
jgi:lysophospholipase L1-like esterase